MRRFWVAGATGFLGSRLVAVLAEQGDHVVAVARGATREAASETSPARGRPNVELLDVDVLDSERVRASAKGAIGAFLAFGKVSRDPKDSEEMHHLHVEGTKAALRGLRAAGVARVVVASTSGTIAVSEREDVADERSKVPHELISRWPYYRTKLYAEQLALAANDPPKFEVVVVNPSLLLGPGDARRSSTKDVELFLHGQVPALPRGGLACVDARDAALGMLAAFERGVAGERYLLSAANLPLDVFFGRISRLSGVPLPRLRMPKDPRLARASHFAFSKLVGAFGGRVDVDAPSADMGSHYWYCDAAKARAELGFTTRPIEDTLRETVRDLLEATRVGGGPRESVASR